MRTLRLEMVFVSFAETPKSATLTPPSEVSRTLAALMSRWIFFSPCRYSNAKMSSRRMYAIVCSSRGACSSCEDRGKKRKEREETEEREEREEGEEREEREETEEW